MVADTAGAAAAVEPASARNGALPRANPAHARQPTAQPAVRRRTRE